MARYLLDTNICIYMMKGPPPKLAARFDANAPHLAISTLTLAELEFGIAYSARPEANAKALDVFAAQLDVLPFDAEAARHFGDIKAAIYRSGTPIGPMDFLIAAHARSLDLTLVTNNRREFDRVRGLRVENWVG